MAGKPKGTGKEINTSMRWECGECHERFDGYWDMVEHKEEKHEQQ